MDISTVTGQTPPQLLQLVIAIARHASVAILEIYNSDFAIKHKDDNSPLTSADLASHHIICNELTTLTPGVPILSEESASVPWPERKTWDTYWLVDPLDGTTEFIKHNGEFTVNIALIHQNNPVLGVVYVPVTNTGYYASTKNGAFMEENGCAPVRILTRETIMGHITAADGSTYSNNQQKQFIKSLGPGTKTITKGSSLKFCLIAEGQVDIYLKLGPTSEWDTAAAQCIVEEAGGLVTDRLFRPLQYNTKISLLNPEFLVIGDKQFDWKSRLDRIG